MTTATDRRAEACPATVPPTADRQRVSPLVWILTIGIVVRLALWFYWSDSPVVIADARDYNGLAVRLIQHGAYVSESGELISLRPPLYPAIVAVIYRVFGIENYAAVRLFQAVLSLVTTVLVYRLGSEVYSRRVGYWAAAAFCFYPPFLGFANLLLSETLFTFFVVALALTTVLALRRQSLGWLALTGILLGLGALTRSILYLYAPFLSVALFFVWRQGFRQPILAAAIPFALTVAVLAPWAWRNTQLHGTLTIVDCMGGRNLMMGNYEYTPLERSWATIDIATGEQAWYRVLARNVPREGHLTQGQLDKVAMSYGLRFMAAHPGLTAKRSLVKFFNYWQLERTLIAGAAAGLFGSFSKTALVLLAALICATNALGVFGGLFGAFTLPPEDRRLHWFLLSLIIFPCAVHTLIFAHSRYLLPQMPVVLLYAAAASVNWRIVWEQRHKWSFRLAVVACLILTAGWLREIVFVDLGRYSHFAG